jgi:hypothetical protein
MARARAARSKQARSSRVRSAPSRKSAADTRRRDPRAASPGKSAATKVRQAEPAARRSESKEPTRARRRERGPEDEKRRESGQPGGGQGRTDEVGRTGVWPMSAALSAPGEAMTVGQAEFGQGLRGAAGYEDSGESEMRLPQPDR